MRLLPNGQVTVPEAIRDQLGLLPQAEAQFDIEGTAARVAKATHPTGETRGQRLVRMLRGSATDRSLTTDEIMAMTRGEE